MTLCLSSPVLRGTVLAGHDLGSVSFGNEADWLRAHGATDTVRFSIAAAAAGKACRFRDRRVSIWALELHKPGALVSADPKQRAA